MHGEDLLIDNGCNGQAVEAVGERLPQLDIVSAFAFVVEAVDTVDRGALMVSTQNEEILGILDLVRKQQADRLQGLFSAIDVVAEEEVVRFWWESAILEQAEKIVVLAMNVTADLAKSALTLKMSILQIRVYLDWCFQLQQDRLRYENLASLGAQVSDLTLQQLHLFTRSTTANLQQTVDYGVQVHLILVGHIFHQQIDLTAEALIS